MYVTQDIANRIKARLKIKGINTKDMLSSLDMGVNAISEFAKGKQMSCISLAKIADYLDCSVDYLLGRTDNPGVNR
ncbi:MAG: helix-turn-helix transcriptional regulator [Clostridiales bacterium]|nr:helix-turn-helix transcriptional regulator [Clostridiales bacterium]